MELTLQQTRLTDKKQEIQTFKGDLYNQLFPDGHEACYLADKQDATNRWTCYYIKQDEANHQLDTLNANIYSSELDHGSVYIERLEIYERNKLEALEQKLDREYRKATEIDAFDSIESWIYAQTKPRRLVIFWRYATRQLSQKTNAWDKRNTLEHSTRKERFEMLLKDDRIALLNIAGNHLRELVPTLKGFEPWKFTDEWDAEYSGENRKAKQLDPTGIRALPPEQRTAAIKQHMDIQSGFQQSSRTAAWQDDPVLPYAEFYGGCIVTR